MSEKKAREMRKESEPVVYQPKARVLSANLNGKQMFAVQLFEPATEGRQEYVIDTELVPAHAFMLVRRLHAGLKRILKRQALAAKFISEVR